MEGMLHSLTPNVSDEFETMVSIFLKIARGETAATARHFLQATSWNFEEALELYLSGGGSRPGHLTQEPNSLINFEQETTRRPGVWYSELGAAASKAETSQQDNLASLYRPPFHLMFNGSFGKETTRRPGVWDSELGAAASKAETSQQDNLASLYRPPFHLMFNGSFGKAKSAASMDDKWLLVNIQSTKEFSSYMVYDDTTEGGNVCVDYILDSIPAVLIIDPITGKKMRSWGGMVQPESLLEGLLTFLDAGPKDHHNALSHKSPIRSSSPSKTKDSDVKGRMRKFKERYQLHLKA